MVKNEGRRHLGNAGSCVLQSGRLGQGCRMFGESTYDKNRDW